MLTDINTYARKGLEAELARLDGELERVRRLLASLDGAAGRNETTPAAIAKRPRQMSEAGRQAIREAVQRRWERVRAAQAGSPDEAQDGKAAGKSRPAAASTRRRGTQQAKASGGRKT